MLPAGVFLYGVGVRTMKLTNMYLDLISVVSCLA